MKRDPFPPNFWPYIFILMSMDVVLAFEDLIGVPVTSPKVLRDLLREEIVRTRYKYATTHPRPEDAPYSTDRILALIEERLGPSARDGLAWWAHNIFSTGTRDRLDLLDWSWLMMDCIDDDAAWRQLSLPSNQPELSREAVREMVSSDRFHIRREEVESRRLSDWDLHMYAFHLFDDDDDVLPDGPLTTLGTCEEAERKYAWWARVCQILRPSELDALWQRATRIAKTTPSLHHVLPLTYPSELGQVRYPNLASQIHSS